METSIDEIALFDLTKICDGKAITLFDKYFKILVLNGLDPKTSHKTKRSLALITTFVPDSDRNTVKLKMQYSYKLAPESPKTATLNCGWRGKSIPKLIENMSIDTEEPQILYDESGYEEVVSWVQLDNLANGAVIERYNYALEKVAANILDPNTVATDTRKIVTKISFTLSDDASHRSMGNGVVDVQWQLAPLSPLSFNLTLYHLEGLKIGVKEHQFSQTNLFETGE